MVEYDFFQTLAAIILLFIFAPLLLVQIFALIAEFSNAIDHLINFFRKIQSNKKVSGAKK